MTSKQARAAARHRIASVAGRGADLVDGVRIRSAHRHAGHGEAVSEAFAHGDDIRQDVPVFAAENLAGSAHACEDFICEKQNIALVKELAEFRKEVVRRHDASAPALNGFEDECRDLSGGGFSDELVIEFQITFRVKCAVGTRPPRTVGVGTRYEIESFGTRRTAEFCHAGESDGVSALAVEIHETTDEFVFACCRAAGAQTCFDRSRAAVIELEAFQVAGKDGRHFFKQPDFDFSREVVGIHQLLCILCDPFGNFRVAVSECRYVNAAGKIDVLIAVNVFQHTAGSTFKCDRKQFDLSGEPTVIFCGSGMKFFAFRPRNRVCHEVRITVEVELIRRWIVLAHSSAPSE